MGTNKPLLMEKPQRGREMRSQQVAGQAKGKTMLMHEGYVGGAKYMVPDEDLEVMRELVDFKLGKKPVDRYVKDYDYTHLPKEQDEKFRKMSQKLQAMDSDDEESDVTDTATSKEEEKPRRTIRFEDSVEKTPSKESEKPSSSEKEEDPQQSVSSNTTGNTQSFETQPSDVDRLRFLLSGHIRSNFKPIFIFHEFDGKSPFGDTPDFSSVKTEGEVDLYISGKFYKDSVLEEVKNKPVSLNIKPNKILIDDRSKVYEEQFYELLRVGEVEIDHRGKFVKQMDTKKYTPFLTFNVLNYPVKNKKKSKKNKVRAKEPTTTVNIAQLQDQNMFHPKIVAQETIDSESSMYIPKKSVEKTPSVPKPEGDWNEYIPFSTSNAQNHLVKSKRTKNKVRTKEPTTTVYIAQSEAQNIFQPKPVVQETVVSDNSVHKPKKSVEKNPSVPNPEGDAKENEPHMKKKPSKRDSTRAMGDIGSEGGLVYNCDVNRSKPSRNIFERLSHMLFSRT